MDFEAIGAVLGMAQTAVGLTGTAVKTADAAKQLFAKDKDKTSERASELLNDLARDLTAANVTNLQLSEALMDLSRQIRAEDAFEKQKARYELVATDEDDMVYRLREDCADGQPIHHVCPVCMNRDKLISFLRMSKNTAYCQTDHLHTYAVKAV